MKIIAVMALFALVVVGSCSSGKLNQQPEPTKLDPSLKDAFGDAVYSQLLKLPQAQATALAGKVVNGTQQVCICCTAI